MVSCQLCLPCQQWFVVSALLPVSHANPPHHSTISLFIAISEKLKNVFKEKITAFFCFLMQASHLLKTDCLLETQNNHAMKLPLT